MQLIEINMIVSFNDKMHGCYEFWMVLFLLSYLFNNSGNKGKSHIFFACLCTSIVTIMATSMLIYLAEQGAHTNSCWRKSCAGIVEQSEGARNRIGIGFSYRPAGLYRLVESIPWNQFLGSLKVKSLRVQNYAKTHQRVRETSVVEPDPHQSD